MNNKQYIKWYMEVANQEYRGNIAILNSNINKHNQIE